MAAAIERAPGSTTTRAEHRCSEEDLATRRRALLYLVFGMREVPSSQVDHIFQPERASRTPFVLHEPRGARRRPDSEMSS